MAKRLSDDEVIAALMTADTKAQAAEQLGVTRQAIYNRLKNDAFKEKLREAMAQRQAAIAEAQQSATYKAVEYLASVVAGEPQRGEWFPSIPTTQERIAAARILLSSPAVKLPEGPAFTG